MTERHENPAATGVPLTTGEFRAAPDVSASTAQFRAFAEDGSEPGRPWEMGAPGRSVARMALLIVGVAVILALVALLVVK
ncbi:MAG: hypothetical protein ACLQFR_03645 [Streptosporangiaceae bacterium]